MKLTQREQRALLKAARAITETLEEPGFYSTSMIFCRTFSCLAIDDADTIGDLSNRYAEATGANAMRFGTHHQYREAIEAVSFETQLARSLCILLYKEANS